jgi:hypothetical protein
MEGESESIISNRTPMYGQEFVCPIHNPNGALARVYTEKGYVIEEVVPGLYAVLPKSE